MRGVDRGKNSDLVKRVFEFLLLERAELDHFKRIDLLIRATPDFIYVAKGALADLLKHLELLKGCTPCHIAIINKD